MTYQTLFYLKYKKGLTTQELLRRYPYHARDVSQVALLDVPEEVLRGILEEEGEFQALMSLKKELSAYLAESANPLKKHP